MRARIKLLWRLLWHGRWRPIEAGVAMIGLYDTLIGEFLPGWPRVGTFLPQTQWWGWVILLLVIVLVAVVEGAYRMSKESVRTPVDGVATSLITVENYDYEFITEGDSSYRQDSVVLRLNPEIHATPGVRVEDIELEMKGKRYSTDWQPMKGTISGDIGNYVYTQLPQSLKEGQYQARIVAHIRNREYYSDDFTVVYRKPTPGKEGYPTQ